MTGFHGKVVLAAFSLFLVAGTCIFPGVAFAASTKQEARGASFVPPTSEDAPLSLIQRSLSASAESEKDAKDGVAQSAAPAPAPAGQSAAEKSAPAAAPPATLASTVSVSVPVAAMAQSAPVPTPSTPSAVATPSQAAPSAAPTSAAPQPAASSVPVPGSSSPPPKPTSVASSPVSPAQTASPSPGANDAAQNESQKNEALKIEKRIDTSPAPVSPAKNDKNSTQAPASNPSDSSPPASTSPAPVAANPPASTSAVASSPLAPANPNAFGLLLADESGFGAGMWKGTAYSTVERLMTSLTLPTISPTLNNLAYRLLASSAVPPEGSSMNILPGPSLPSIRIAKLVELGRPVEAWRMATIAREGQLDDDTLRSTAEAVLASGDATSIAEVCARAPDILKGKVSPDWQKAIVVCGLRANDMKSAQLALDVMAAQNIKDDIFFFLATKNALGGSKQLPRQLTPLKPLSLALLRFSNLPLRNELYARPAAAMIPEVLRAKTDNLGARLALAERAAALGLIDAEFLGKIYADVDFSNSPATAREMEANNVRETGPILRARLYQIAMSDKGTDNRLFAAVRLLQSVTPVEQGGAMRNLALAMLGDLTPQKSSSLMIATPAAALMISLMSDDKPEHTMGWLKATRDIAAQTPSAAKALISLWPLMALDGVESDKDFARNLHDWLKYILKAKDSDGPAVSASTSVTAALIQEDKALRERREVAGTILLALDAVGFSIPDDAWSQVVDAPGTFDKVQLPSAMLLERLRSSASAKRKGETVLEALASTNGIASPGAAANDIPFAVRIDIIRALRHAGFVQEAASFARESLLAMRVISAGGSNGNDSR